VRTAHARFCGSRGGQPPGYQTAIAGVSPSEGSPVENAPLVMCATTTRIRRERAAAVAQRICTNKCPGPRSISS